MVYLSYFTIVNSHSSPELLDVFRKPYYIFYWYEKHWKIIPLNAALVIILISTWYKDSDHSERNSEISFREDFINSYLSSSGENNRMKLFFLFVCLFNL